MRNRATYYGDCKSPYSAPADCKSAGQRIANPLGRGANTKAKLGEHRPARPRARAIPDEGHLGGREDLFGQGGERIDTHIFFPRHPYLIHTTPISPSCEIYPILRGDMGFKLGWGFFAAQNKAKLTHRLFVGNVFFIEKDKLSNNVCQIYLQK